MTSRVTTHVLDATSGTPARGVTVTLERQDEATWSLLAQGMTDADGRITDLGPEDLTVGTYRVSFETGDYFTRLDQPHFYPEVVIAFRIEDEQAHHHVPLLLSPYAYSTYRGS